MKEARKKRWSDPAARKAQAELLKELWKTQRRNFLDGARKKRWTPEARAAARARIKKLWSDPEFKKSRKEKVRKALFGKEAKGKNARGVDHIHSKTWHLRDPSGVTHTFRNLSEFIRQHPHLFNKEAVVWKRYGKRQRWACNALAGLNSLSPNRKNPQGSWHGWTWNSATEVFYNQQQDLLNRQPHENTSTDQRPICAPQEVCHRD